MCARIRWSCVALFCSTLVTLTSAAACAARQAPAARYDDLDRSSMVRGGHACDRSDQDTTHYLHLPLYRSCAVSVTARRTASDVKPEYWPTGRDRNCFAALVEIAVDTLGRPEPRTARLVRASDPGYAAAVLAIVPSLRFEPARMAGRPVRQIYELREVLLIRRGAGVTGGGGQRLRGARGTGSMSGSMSEVPTGAELPTMQNLGSVC